MLDGAGEPVPDAMVEIWQADAAGEYGAELRLGPLRARTTTGASGSSRSSPGRSTGQAPHLLVLVFARGLLKPVLTRMYFPDEAEANAGRPGARDGAGRASARRSSPRRTATACASTSGCRATARRAFFDL